MYCEVMGRQLLKVWCKQTGEVVTPREFFEQTYYPLFLADARLLQWVANSPFAQAKGVSAEHRQAQLNRLHELIAQATAVNGPGLDASIAPGFPAAGTTATTAGQVSDLAPRSTADSGYYAWIGAAAGIGVSGGLTLALGEEVILWALLEGWTHYRELLRERPEMKGNQIETWNGQWLAHRFGPAYEPAQPMKGFPLEQILVQQPGGQALSTHSWVNLLLMLAPHLPDTTAYVYSLGQTNRTVGFVRLHLSELRTLPELAHRLFTLDGSGADWPKLSAAYETRLGLGRACETGSLGLVALEPTPLRTVIATKLGPPKNPAQALKQETYKLWLTAMLHHTQSTDATATPTGGPSGQQLTEAAERLAEGLLRYAAHEPGKSKGRGTTKYAQLVQQVFVPSIPAFIRQLTLLLEATPAAPEYRELFLDSVNLTQGLSASSFAMFQALLKFRYTAG